MKNWIYKLFAASAAIVLIFGCEPNIDVPAPSSGGADFSNYIAVGNSLTAGYADGWSLCMMGKCSLTLP
jgi:hypothetical protein